jgi:hypothetical protein
MKALRYEINTLMNQSVVQRVSHSREVDVVRSAYMS